MLRPVAVVAALSLAVAPLHSQDLVALCKQMSHPAVGSWSSFRFVGGNNDGATMKISVVGSESHGDTAYLWLEMAMDGFEGARGRSSPACPKCWSRDSDPAWRIPAR